MRTLLPLIIALSIPAQAAVVHTYCWQDVDGDGYYNPSTATWRAHEYEDWVSGTATCDASGGAEQVFKFDCDDGDASRHPRAAERGNGSDDNCNGKTDEPTFSWPSRSGSRQTDSSISMHTYVNDAAVLSAGDTGWVGTNVSYREISETTWKTVSPSAYDVKTAHPYTDLKVSGLDAGKVYAFKVQFRKWTTGGWRDVGEESDHFFSMTTDSGADIPGDVRTDVVIGALRNYARSNNGYIGYRGTTSVDGASNFTGSSGYGAAVGGNTQNGYERWCSEAYVGHTMDYVALSAGTYTTPTNGNNSVVGAIGTISELSDEWFNRPGSTWAAAGAYQGTGCASTTCSSTFAARLTISFSGQPGDWVHAPGHSAMFLGFNSATQKVWVVDGNGSFPADDMGILTAPPADASGAWLADSNVVSVRTFDLSTFNGVGVLHPDMF